MIAPGEWAPAAGIELEPNALRAVLETNSSVALTAGPGAGKTELLAQRADFLLRTGTCRYPRRILAISFKVDANRNLYNRVYERSGSSLSARFDGHTFHGFAKRIIDKFRVVLADDDALPVDYVVGDDRILGQQITFQDMVPLANEILRSSDLARLAIRKTYSFVLLDEFQDCTNVQYDMIRLCFLGTDSILTAVGDTKQRIMGWAGALEGVTETFADDFGAERLNLYQNFRSRPRLRRIQNEMIKVMDVNAALPDEVLVGDDGVAEILEFESSGAEAEGIADRVQHWLEVDEVPRAEVAILVSKRPDLYAVELVRAMAERGIPLREEQQLQDLSAEPITRLILNFCSVVCLSRQPDALSTLLKDALDPTLDDESSLVLHSRWRRFIRRHREIFAAFGAETWMSDLLPMAVASLLQEMGQARAIALSPDYEQGNRMSALVDETCELMQHLMLEVGDVAAVLARFADDQSVRLMTIHKSKGLEFDSVVIIGVEEETFWGDREAERAAFFVGASRAKRRLCLTVARTRQRPAGAPRWDVVRSPLDEFISYVRDAS